ncbi:predicted protein [Histoplasma mississippiense (nom. inval.)]|uniref:predicted protein n=1 Tax=Ajellomyces capsulatus (strain NAm1 / WU24) TaxID=2059318 RepID=UPI000157B8F7|nr:predicted protein [Histoplasma mississippiense (nom. inval.)]EDN03765.1 predicted protein [Histoplasma mississippiense (nom. inval.)]
MSSSIFLPDISLKRAYKEADKAYDYALVLLAFERRPPLPPQVPPLGPLLPQEEPFDEEICPSYNPKKLYPAKPGEVLANRYQILVKDLKLGDIMVTFEDPASARLDDQDDWGIYPIRPDHYHAPEDIIQGKELFRQVYDAQGHFDAKAHLAEMIALLGPPHPRAGGKIPLDAGQIRSGAWEKRECNAFVQIIPETNTKTLFGHYTPWSVESALPDSLPPRLLHRLDGRTVPAIKAKGNDLGIRIWSLREPTFPKVSAQPAMLSSMSKNRELSVLTLYYLAWRPPRRRALLAVLRSRSADSAKGRIIAAKRPRAGDLRELHAIRRNTQSRRREFPESQLPGPPPDAATTGRSGATAHAQCPVPNVQCPCCSGPWNLVVFRAAGMYD